VVVIADRGAGIPSQRQAHIFEPFYEAIPAGQPGYVGIVSLGLHVCKRIVDAHQGRIWFNQTPGGGTTISVSLSLAPKPQRSAPGAE
jgi:signal transduction histidine kinase